MVTWGITTAALAAVLACSAGHDVRVRVVVPERGTDAYPYDHIDRIEMAVIREGTGEVVSAGTFQRGRELILRDVPFGLGLAVHVTGLDGTTEVSYGRSCALDLGPEALETTVFLARIGKWATWHVPADPVRRSTTAYVTPIGDGLFVGGELDATTVERFDPRTDEFTLLRDTVVSRSDATLAAFGDGRALLVGGTVANGDATDIAELVEPYRGSGEVVRFSDPSFRVVGVAASTLVDGAVLVVGGALQPQPGAAFSPRADAFLFSTIGGALELDRRRTGSLAIARAWHTATRLGDDLGAGVLVIGGLGTDGLPIAGAELYEPARGAFASPAEFSATLAFPRYGHTAGTLADGSIVVVGGRDAANAPVLAIEVYLPRLGRFQTAGSLPAAAGITEHTITELADGRLLLAGGRDVSGNPVSSSYLIRYDPIDGEIELVPTAPLGSPRARHAAARVCDGTVLVVGGGDPRSERYNPIAVGRR